MQVEGTFIDGVKLVRLATFSDQRGAFTKVYHEDIFHEHGLRIDFKESFFSVSHKNVIRGMHFQVPPAEAQKLVYVNQGSIIDVVLDIRKSSPTYGRHFFTSMSDKQPVVIYIPEGCAHGFISLEDNTIVSYLQTAVYNKECDKGIRWDSFGMNWGIDNPVVSERDALFPALADYNSPFL